MTRVTMLMPSKLWTRPFGYLPTINNAIAWDNKGLALYSHGEYDEAVKAYEEAIRLNPKDADAWIGKGSALGKQGKYDEVIKAYEEAIRLDPKLAMAWYNKGNALDDRQVL